MSAKSTDTRLVAELVPQVHHCLLPFSWKCWKWWQTWQCSMSEIWIQSKCYILLPFVTTQTRARLWNNVPHSLRHLQLLRFNADLSRFNLLTSVRLAIKFCCGMLGSISLVTCHIGSTMLGIPPQFTEVSLLVPIMDIQVWWQAVLRTWFKNITSHNDYSMIQLFFTKRLTNSQTNGPPAKHHTLWVLRNAERGRGSGPSRSSFSSNGLPANMQTSNPCKLTGPERKNIRNVLVSIALPPFPGWRWPTASSLTCTYKWARNKSSLCKYLQVTSSDCGTSIAPAPTSAAAESSWNWYSIPKFKPCIEGVSSCLMVFNIFCFYGIELNIQPSWLGLGHVLPNTRGASPPMSRA